MLGMTCGVEECLMESRPSSPSPQESTLGMALWRMPRRKGRLQQHLCFQYGGWIVLMLLHDVFVLLYFPFSRF